MGERERKEFFIFFRIFSRKVKNNLSCKKHDHVKPERFGNLIDYLPKCLKNGETIND